MTSIEWPSRLSTPTLLALLLMVAVLESDADEKYNLQNRDGSFQFGYDTPDSYHFAEGNRNNVVRGEFGGRNPATGAIDKTDYTAGPRGYRPRGINIHRKYDQNQNGPRAVGSRDDPYYDPYEDPSYAFSFRTRTYSRTENSNRLGDVRGSYTYLDDIGERHNVEFIAGKNTGFHVKTPFPDSNPRNYGPLYFSGRGKKPRGRTSIQRELDGSYRFVSSGPDQRRTETADSTGHVRGSYTYLDDKGVQHSVHYIAGPETGYRVLKNVKGAHLPSVFPFSRPDVLSPDFYDAFDKQQQPITDDNGVQPFDNIRPSRPRPNFDENDDGPDVDPFAGSFGKPSQVSSTERPSSSSFKPEEDGFKAEDDGSYKPSGDEDDGRYRPSVRDGLQENVSKRPGGDDDFQDDGDFGGLFGSESSNKPPPGDKIPKAPEQKLEENNEEDDGDLFGKRPEGFFGSSTQRPSDDEFNFEPAVGGGGGGSDSTGYGDGRPNGGIAGDFLDRGTRTPSPSEQFKAETLNLKKVRFGDGDDAANKTRRQTDKKRKNSGGESRMF